MHVDEMKIEAGLKPGKVPESGVPAHRARAIMVQGTMSNAGKSLLVAGLCRIFHEDGYRVAPFKAQNMALNSFITDEGLEMGRAQVVQAEAAGIAPNARMNPVLLKPTTDVGSQVIVRGVAQGNMTAREYYRNKWALLPVVRAAYESLASEYDIIVIEGAGSPAEVNLREDDLVNMGMAAIADAPVLLVGDIDRGGVFAQLLGTLELLEPEERARIRGLIINKFRGDKTILDPGLDILEARTGKAVLGVVPYLDVALEDEDSLSTALEQRQAEGGLDIAVIRLPRISNFTDFTALATEPGVSVRYVSSVRELGEPDVLILPGTKSTIRDLDWLRSTGLEAKILQKQARGTLILGICGGFQMLGTEVVDVEGVEGPVGARTRGLGLLPLRTEFEAEKTRTQTRLVLEGLTGEFAALNGQRVDGYEIHMGRTIPDHHTTDAVPRGNAPDDSTRWRDEAMVPAGPASGAVTTSHPADSCLYAQAGNVFGTYLHGFFDRDGLRNAFVERLCRRKGIDPGDREVVNYEAFKEAQFAKLSAALRASLDMARIYEILEGEQV
ncbi:cobyric acid synthase [Oribacterium sp. HCP3S3_B9]|uniref:cobyric acid synthase n=1 Tax=Oribacterium sp. HCP3S3_B9 TaxID=3438946 RepID=UPI003F8BC88D